MLRLLVFAGTLLIAGPAFAQVSVSGYTRSDGTYVAPYIRSSPNGTTADNYGASRQSAPGYATPSYSVPATSAPVCSGYACYGQPSSANGRPRTNYVQGYTRRDGTYVSGYFRSE